MIKASTNPRRLKRIDDGWIGGVCAGFAYYLGIDTWIIRFPVLIPFFLSPSIFSVVSTTYIILWFIMPKYDKIPKDYQRVA